MHCSTLQCCALNFTALKCTRLHCTVVHYTLSAMLVSAGCTVEEDYRWKKAIMGNRGEDQTRPGVTAPTCGHWETWLKQIIRVFRCLSPFKIGIHISLEQSVWADLSWNPFPKGIASICFGPNHLGKKISGKNLDFCQSFFQFFRWNWVFRTNMESNAAVTLHLENLAVQSYLFLKHVFICW